MSRATITSSATGGAPGMPRSGGAGSLALERGLAQCHVDVDDPGEHDLAGRLDGLDALRRGQLRPDALDRRALDQDVGNRVHLVRRIDHAPVLDEQASRSAHAFSPAPLLPASRNRTPMRTATPLATWSRITEYGPSATSGDSSTPRFTGPGCMINTSGRAWAASLSSVRPQ